MKISTAWLNEWVHSGWDPRTLAERLTMAGFEVESIERAAPVLDGVVVARITSCEPHPDAAKLRVCQVEDGSGSPVQVVCGAANARPGLVSAFARVGAVLPGDVRISSARLRGVESLGMLCSARELGLGEGHAGILELGDGYQPGTSLTEALALDDNILELSITPNRGDALSVLGIAREVAAISGQPLVTPSMPRVTATLPDVFDVQLEAGEACPTFVGRVVRGVRPEATSPLWLQERLRRAGLRSISPVVDVTNLVMLEMGQPMHAYDLRRLNGGIRVRWARAGETLRLLDGREVVLGPDVLMIADASGPIGLAGIMGGEASGIDPDTTDVFLEVAFFQPAAVAGRARRFGLQTDASQRFERGVDPCLQERAMERATALLLEIAGGEPGPTVVSGKPLSGLERSPIEVSIEFLEKRLGLPLEVNEVVDALKALGMEVNQSGDDLRVLPPSHRFDLAIPEDLSEEVARIHGYDRIQPVDATAGQVAAPSTESRVPERRYLSLLADRGYQEVISYAFTGREEQLRFAGQTALVELANPLSAELAAMRLSLWPGLMAALTGNVRRQRERVRLFEHGRGFPAGAVEKNLLAAVAWGAVLPEQWSSDRREVDFYDLKGDLEALLQLGNSIRDIRFESASHPALHPGRSARIIIRENSVGWIGELHPALLQAYDLRTPPLLFEVDADLSFMSELPVYHGISRYPSVRRDLALVVPESILLDQILESVSVSSGSALREVRVFDVYRGPGLEPGFKSVAMGLILQKFEGTLTDHDADALVASVVSRLSTDCGARIRN